MGAACCRCVQPASVQPRKTYNSLVPQLFDGIPIKTDEPIDSTMRRKIQKLQEYLQNNPAKVPKASRRLMRRIKATLRKPGDNLGHVKVAVHTYAYLLAMSADENSSYGPTFFLKELLTGPDAVVPLLLKDIHIEMRTLGAELLAVFTRVQSPVDSKLDSIQAHVPQVCRVAQGALRSDRKEQKLQETAERRRAGDKLAVPDPIYLIGRRAPAHVAALEVSCLHCLKEVVVLCRKNKVVPAQIHEIQAVMLDNLAPSRGGAGAQSAGGATAGEQAAAVPTGVVDDAFYSAMGMQQLLPEGTHPREQAEQLLLHMASFTQDISMVDKILDSFYEYMDDRERWQEAGVVKNFLAALGAGGGQHPYPIFASLLRHACQRKLAIADCAAVLQVAKEQGVQLDEAYSLSALQLALDELPQAWAEQARRDPKGMFMKPFLEFLRVGTAAMMDGLAHLGESPVPGQQPGSAAAAQKAAHSSSQAGTAAITQAARDVQLSAGGGAGAGGGGGGGDAAGGTLVQRQLAHLKLTMLQMVHALAGRVQTAAELCEVITGVLNAAAASLNYPSCSSPPVLSTAGGPACAAAALGGSGAGGASPFQPAATLPPTVSFGGAGGRDGAGAAPGAADEGKLAAVLMALQLAAAAADGCLSAQQEHFVTPCSSFTGTGIAPSSSDTQRSLPGGVLPSKLVAAALPLLTQGPHVLRHAVQRILLALLPAAPQGVASAHQASQLAEAALLELSLAQNPPAAAAVADGVAAHDTAHEYGPALVAGVDGILRCCLRGQRPHAAAVLSIARGLLQQGQQWVEQGYRSLGAGSADRAVAVLLLFNSQVGMLADATKRPSLRSHQLPLDPQGHPSLQLTAAGLLLPATASAHASTAGCSAALHALEQQQPTSRQQVDSLRAELLQVPLLVEAYGEQLPSLLDSQLALRLSMTGSSGDGDTRERTRLTSRVSGQLPERKPTLSKGKMLHVGDLLQRNSMTRSANLPPVASFLDNAPSHPQLQGASVTGASATRGVSYTGPVATLAEASPVAAAAAAVAAATATLSSGTRAVSLVQAPGSAIMAAAPTTNGLKPVAAVSPDGVHVEVPAAAPASLSDAVAAVLKQPAPAGAYVVRDIKISKLAGELDSQL